jgi:hypothetical protein
MAWKKTKEAKHILTYQYRAQPLTGRWSENAKDVLDQMARRQNALWNKYVELFHTDRRERTAKAIAEHPEARDLLHEIALVENEIMGINRQIAKLKQERGKERRDGAVSMMDAIYQQQIQDLDADIRSKLDSLRELRKRLSAFIKNYDPILTPKALYTLRKGFDLRDRDSEDVQRRFDGTLKRLYGRSGGAPKFHKYVDESDLVIAERYVHRHMPSVHDFLTRGKSIFRMQENGILRVKAATKSRTDGRRNDEIIKADLVFHLVVHRLPIDMDGRVSMVRLCRRKRKHGPYRWYINITVETDKRPVRPIHRLNLGGDVTYVPMPYAGEDGTFSAGYLLRDGLMYSLGLPGSGCTEPDFQNVRYGVASRLIMADANQAVAKTTSSEWHWRHYSAIMERLAAMRLDWARKIAYRVCMTCNHIVLPATHLQIHGRRSKTTHMTRAAERLRNANTRNAAPMLVAQCIDTCARKYGISVSRYTANEYATLLERIGDGTFRAVTAQDFWGICADSVAQS